MSRLGKSPLWFALMFVALGFAIARGRDRELRHDVGEACRSMRIQVTATAAREIAQRSGGRVEATPTGFRVRFERHFYRGDIGCVVETDGDKVVRSVFERFHDDP
jgi:hypothetical protein